MGDEVPNPTLAGHLEKFLYFSFREKKNKIFKIKIKISIKLLDYKDIQGYPVF